MWTQQLTQRVNFQSRSVRHKPWRLENSFAKKTSGKHRWTSFLPHGLENGLDFSPRGLGSGTLALVYHNTHTTFTPTPVHIFGQPKMQNVPTDTGKQRNTDPTQLHEFVRLIIKISLSILQIFHLTADLSNKNIWFLYIKIWGKKKRFTAFLSSDLSRKAWTKKMETLLSDNTLIKPDTSNNVAASTRSFCLSARFCFICWSYRRSLRYTCLCSFVLAST